MAEHDRQVISPRFIHKINAVECRDNGMSACRYIVFVDRDSWSSGKLQCQSSLMKRLGCSAEISSLPCAQGVTARPIAVALPIRWIDDWSSDFSFIEDDIGLSICHVFASEYAMRKWSEYVRAKLRHGTSNFLFKKKIAFLSFLNCFSLHFTWDCRSWIFQITVCKCW